MNKKRSIREKTKFATECAYAAAGASKYESYTIMWNHIWKQTYEDAFLHPHNYKTNLL